MLLIALVFVIAGSAKAVERFPEFKYYESPVFALINVVVMIPFAFWLVPVTIANHYNAMINITTKEREALNEATIFKPEALREKKMISNRQKFRNLMEVLFAARIKSEIH